MIVPPGPIHHSLGGDWDNHLSHTNSFLARGETRVVKGIKPVSTNCKLVFERKFSQEVDLVFLKKRNRKGREESIAN